METVLMFIKAYAVGGAICTIAQLLINYTKITSGKILVSFLLAGVALEAVGLYQYLVDLRARGQPYLYAGLGIFWQRVQ